MENKKEAFYFGGFWFLLGFIICLGICELSHKDNKVQVPVYYIINNDTTQLNGDSIYKIKAGKTANLSDNNLYKELKVQGIIHPKIVLAQAKLETGNYKSNQCIKSNNLFGLRKKNGSYYRFNHWKESVTAYKKYIQDRYDNSSNYYVFLKRIGYSEEDDYTDKVKDIVDQV